MTPEQIYKSLSAGVVMVQSTFANAGTNIFGQTQSGQALGTGFVVDKNGYILTNAHVVQEQGQNASTLTVVFNKGSAKTQEVKGTLIGVDSGSDVAVLKVNPSRVDLHPLPLGNSNDVPPGEPVVAIGNPLGYDFSITAGIVSATGRTLDAPNGLKIPNGIQTDAAINPGNSGGPLIDPTGKVIGINEQIATQSGGNEGLGLPWRHGCRYRGDLESVGCVQGTSVAETMPAVMEKSYIGCATTGSPTGTLSELPRGSGWRIKADGFTLSTATSLPLSTPIRGT